MSGPCGSESSQEAARKIRVTLVELLSVAKLGGLDETARHLETAIAEADRAAGVHGGMASQHRERRRT